jgi:hypothetical protein
MSERRHVLSLLIIAAGILLLAACGGSSDGDTTMSATPSPSPVRGPIAAPNYCIFTMGAAPELGLQLSARWEGNDKIIAEGNVDLPGPARLQAWICQDGQVTVALRLERDPELKGRKIKVEWKKQDVEVGPVFDPDAHFEVVLAALGEPVGVPYFVERIPVEGKPE